MMAVVHSLTPYIWQQPLADVLNLCHVKRRAAIRFKRINGPNINRQFGVSIMPLIPVTALSYILQGHAL